MKKVIASTLVAFSLAGCQVPEFREVTRRVWSFKFDQCYCQAYDLNNPGPLEELYKCEKRFCDDILGFSADEWALDITPTGKELRRWGQDECR
jgi:hypothetical protein